MKKNTPNHGTYSSLRAQRNHGMWMITLKEVALERSINITTPEFRLIAERSYLAGLTVTDTIEVLTDLL